MLPLFSVRRPVTVLMILSAMLVLGFIAYLRIPLALFPQGYERESLGVFVPWRNASPGDIEEKITRHVEDMIGTMPNVRGTRSWIRSNSSFTRVEFETGTNMRQAYAILRDRMDRVLSELPEDVEQAWVRRWDESDAPIINLVAAVPPAMEDPWHVMEVVVQPALQRIEGVGNVGIWGLDRREIRIELNEQRVRSHQIDLDALVRRLRNENFNLAGGYVHEGGQKMYIRSVGVIDDLTALENFVVDREGRIRLRDIAELSLSPPRRRSIYRVDGQPAIGIQVTRDSTGNIERISRETRAVLAELREDPRLAGVNFDVVFDQGEHVRQSIDNLKSSGLWGGLFAATVILVFLRAPRMTAILTLAIPLSLLCTVTVIYFTGWTLNMATMAGLMISIGLVIDNSIVIAENIFRRRQEGRKAEYASILGAGEVGLAVTMATLTTVVVFLPIVLMSEGREFSFMMLRVGVPVICSLLASLFIALVFIPLAAQRFSSGRRHTEMVLLARGRAAYQRILELSLRRRLDAVLIIALLAATVFWPVRNVERVDSTRGTDDLEVRLSFDLPSSEDSDQAEAFITRVESFLTANAEQYGIVRTESRVYEASGRITLRLKDDPLLAWYAVVWDTLLGAMGHRDRPMTKEEVEEDFRTRFDLPVGVTLRTTRRGADFTRGLTVNLYGDDTETLIGYAAEVERRLMTIPEVMAVETDLDRGNTELRVLLDRDKTEPLGVEPRAVSSGIASAMRGLEAGRFYSPDGREMRIRVQLDETDRQSIDALRSMTFSTDSGIEVPLESLARLDMVPALGSIRHENRQTVLAVRAIVARGDAGAMFTKVDQVMEGFEMPRGYRWDKGARYVSLQESDRAQRFAIILAIIFVFLLMGILFESFVLPLAVIVAVPFSFVGVYWMLYLTGTQMNMMAMVGTVILIGIVVNNAIVLVDLTNRLRGEGKSRTEALLLAGRHRFRPILMTTCTTVFGLMPMALSRAEMIGMPYSPLGRAIIGGLLVSATVTLILVPLFYTLLDDLQEAMRSRCRLWLRPGGETPPVEAAPESKAS